MANDAKTIWDFLISKGFNKYATAGIMGNLYAESLLKSNNLQNSANSKLNMTDEEYTKAVDNGSYNNFANDNNGYGLAQWTFHTRKQNLYNYSKQKNVSISDITMQLEFLISELKEQFISVYNTLQSSTNIKDATIIFMIKFEAPANQSDSAKNARISYATKYYNLYATDTNEISTSTKTELLKRGSSGNAVKTLQQNLISLGYSCGNAGVDGQFGKDTFNAVVKFQTDYKLEVDGIVGPQTLRTIQTALTNSSTQTTPSENQSTQNFILSKGSKGTSVQDLQIKLIELGYSCGSYGADGSFGNATESAVKSYQKDNNLEQTGAIDERTLNSIDSKYKQLQANYTYSDFTASKLLQIARAEIGYYEKNSNSNLDDKTANKGSNNWTKYARDLSKAGYYNGNKNGYAWCDVFVDWCFFQLANKNPIKAQDIQCQTGSLGACCNYSAQYYRNKGRFSKIPQVGDQIFFGTSGHEEHTGIVEQVTDTKIITIEGNTSDQVARRTYSRNSSRISGYGHPKFNPEVNVVSPQQAENEDKTQIMQVKITANSLNIRSGPGTSYSIVGTTSSGEFYEVSEVSNGWGKIELGWIYLAYTQEV